MAFSLKALDISERRSAEQISNFVIGNFCCSIFHHPKFLGYHGSRFANQETYLAWFKGEQLFAVMPAAQFEDGERKILRSPYGASFGGMLSKSSMRLKEALSVVDALLQYCESQSIDEVQLSFPPEIYFSRGNDALFFALEKAGFTLKARDIFSIVDISKGYEEAWKNYEGRARTAVRKSSNSFEIKTDSCLDEFYGILLEDKSRLDSTPTHTLDELLRIKGSFPDRVWCDLAVHKETGARAGICYFAVTDKVVMTFYMSQETAALKLNGINVLVDYGIKNAIDQGFQYFDFGGSTVGYEVQNIGVANFKESFGALSTSRLTYKWSKGRE